MKRTLLDLTQNILSSLNSDEVNSIGDTTESLQVAEIIRTTYYNMVTRAGLPEHNELFQLDASTDGDLPVLMTKPDRVSKIEWIKYYNADTDGQQSSDPDGFIHDLNVDLVSSDSDDDSSPPSYQYVTILPVKQFLDMVNRFDTTQDNVTTYTFTDGTSNFTFNAYTDRQPCYCTVVSDYWILFDSYNNELDNTLQSSKSMCFGQILPTFTMQDSFTPDLDDQQFPLLLNEAKSLAFFELKQMAHPKAEQESKRQWSSIQKNKSLVNKPSYFNQLPDFGRR